MTSEPTTINETQGERQARHAVAALSRLGRSMVIAPEFVSAQGACQLLTISKSTFWRLRQADPSFPRGITVAGIERISVAALRAWALAQPPYAAAGRAE